jgi:hypothetical protein
LDWQPEAARRLSRVTATEVHFVRSGGASVQAASPADRRGTKLETKETKGGGHRASYDAALALACVDAAGNA